MDQIVELQMLILELLARKLVALLEVKRKPEEAASRAQIHGKFTCADKRIQLTTETTFHWPKELDLISKRTWKTKLLTLLFHYNN